MGQLGVMINTTSNAYLVCMKLSNPDLNVRAFSDLLAQSTGGGAYKNPSETLRIVHKRFFPSEYSKNLVDTRLIFEKHGVKQAQRYVREVMTRPIKNENNRVLPFLICISILFSLALRQFVMVKTSPSNTLVPIVIVFFVWLYSICTYDQTARGVKDQLQYVYQRKSLEAAYRYGLEEKSHLFRGLILLVPIILCWCLYAMRVDAVLGAVSYFVVWTLEFLLSLSWLEILASSVAPVVSILCCTVWVRNVTYMCGIKKVREQDSRSTIKMPNAAVLSVNRIVWVYPVILSVSTLVWAMMFIGPIRVPTSSARGFYEFDLIREVVGSVAMVVERTLDKLSFLRIPYNVIASSLILFPTLLETFSNEPLLAQAAISVISLVVYVCSPLELSSDTSLSRLRQIYGNIHFSPKAVGHGLKAASISRYCSQGPPGPGLPHVQRFEDEYFKEVGLPKRSAQVFGRQILDAAYVDFSLHWRVLGFQIVTLLVSSRAAYCTEFDGKNYVLWGLYTLWSAVLCILLSRRTSPFLHDKLLTGVRNTKGGLVIGPSYCSTLSWLAWACNVTVYLSMVMFRVTKTSAMSGSLLPLATYGLVFFQNVRSSSEFNEYMRRLIIQWNELSPVDRVHRCSIASDLLMRDAHLMRQRSLARMSSADDHVVGKVTYRFEIKKFNPVNRLARPVLRRFPSFASVTSDRFFVYFPSVGDFQKIFDRKCRDPGEYMSGLSSTARTLIVYHAISSFSTRVRIGKTFNVSDIRDIPSLVENRGATGPIDTPWKTVGDMIDDPVGIETITEEFKNICSGEPTKMVGKLIQKFEKLLKKPVGQGHPDMPFGKCPRLIGASNAIKTLCWKLGSQNRDKLFYAHPDVFGISPSQPWFGDSSFGDFVVGIPTRKRSPGDTIRGRDRIYRKSSGVATIRSNDVSSYDLSVDTTLDLLLSAIYVGDAETEEDANIVSRTRRDMDFDQASPIMACPDSLLRTTDPKRHSGYPDTSVANGFQRSMLAFVSFVLFFEANEEKFDDIESSYPTEPRPIMLFNESSRHVVNGDDYIGAWEGAMASIYTRDAEEEQMRVLGFKLTDFIETTSMQDHTFNSQRFVKVQVAKRSHSRSHYAVDRDWRDVVGKMLLVLKDGDTSDPTYCSYLLGVVQSYRILYFQKEPVRLVADYIRRCVHEMHGHVSVEPVEAVYGMDEMPTSWLSDVEIAEMRNEPVGPLLDRDQLSHFIEDGVRLTDVLLGKPVAQVPASFEPVVHSTVSTVLVVGGTGTGKTVRTVLTKATRGDTVLVLPTRLQCDTKREFFSRWFSTSVSYRGARRMETRLVCTTPGTFFKRKDLWGRHVIFDEAHMYVDFVNLVGPKIAGYSNKPVLIVTATPTGLSAAETVNLGSIPFEITKHFFDGDLEEKVAEVVSHGPTLVFCTTRRECDRLASSLLNRGISACPLHGGRSIASMTSSIRQLEWQYKNKEKSYVLVATNVVESSVTLPGMVNVVDDGYRLDVKTKGCMTTTQRVRISRGMSDQRAGRVGRTCAGHVYRRYKYEDLSEYHIIDEKIDSMKKVLDGDDDQLDRLSVSAGVDRSTSSWALKRTESNLVRALLCCLILFAKDSSRCGTAYCRRYLKMFRRAYELGRRHGMSDEESTFATCFESFNGFDPQEPTTFEDAIDELCRVCPISGSSRVVSWLLTPKGEFPNVKFDPDILTFDRGLYKNRHD